MNEELTIEAAESATARGHDLTPFSRVTAWGYRPGATRSTCRACGREVTVNPHPMPNQVAIGGEAVALNCSER